MWRRVSQNENPFRQEVLIWTPVTVADTSDASSIRPELCVRTLCYIDQILGLALNKNNRYDRNDNLSHTKHLDDTLRSESYWIDSYKASVIKLTLY